MKVRIPSQLRSYTAGAALVDIDPPLRAGVSPVVAALAALDARFPGLRFRIIDEQEAIRPHIKLFADGVLLRDLAAAPARVHELMIVGALSGG